MAKVMRMHRDAVKSIPASVPSDLLAADGKGEFGLLGDQLFGFWVVTERFLGQGADQDFQKFRIDGTFTHDLIQENIKDDNCRRPETVNGSVGPRASKIFTSCLRAASSSHLLSRRNNSRSSSIAASF